MPDSLVNYLIPNLAIASLEFLLVGFLVVVLLAIRPNISPIWRRRIWLLAMLKPFVTMLTGFFPGLIQLPAFLTSGNFLGDLLSPPGDGDGLVAMGGSSALLVKIIAYVWVVGTGAMLYWLWRRALVSNQLIEEATKSGYLLKPESVKLLDPTLDVAPSAKIIITPDECGPATLGAWRSVVVIPESLLPWVIEHRDPTHLERDRFIQVLRHELSHLVRRDDRATMLAAIAVAFFWFHPIAHWAYNRVRINNELCCDMQVVASGVNPSDYVNTLMNVVSGQFDRKGFSMGILGDASPANVLRRRLHFLLSDELAKSMMDRSKWAYCIVGIMFLTLPRLIASVDLLVEVVDSNGQIVRVTLEALAENPQWQLVDSPVARFPATPHLTGEPASLPSVNGSAPSDLIEPDKNTPEPSSTDSAELPEGDMLTNVEEEETEAASKTTPKAPSRQRGGRGWAGGSVGGSTPPDSPILPPRPPQ